VQHDAGAARGAAWADAERVVVRAQALDGLGGIARDDGEPMGMVLAPAGQGVGEVGEALRAPLDRLGDRGGPRRQGLGAPGGDQDEGLALDPLAGRRRRLVGRLQDRVDVGAAHAEAAHGRAARPRARPGAPAIEQVERRARELEHRVHGVEVEDRGELAVPQREHGLDEASDAGRALEVSEVRLHRADRAEAAAIGAGRERAAGGLDLDRIAEGGAGAVGLQQADAVGGDAGPVQGVEDQRLLRLGVRRADAERAAVLVGDGGAEDGVDGVAQRSGAGEPLQHDDADAFARHVAVRPGREGRAATVG
jgi:hypothetical protein